MSNHSEKTQHNTANTLWVSAKYMYLLQKKKTDKFIIETLNWKHQYDNKSIRAENQTQKILPSIRRDRTIKYHQYSTRVQTCSSRGPGILELTCNGIISREMGLYQSLRVQIIQCIFFTIRPKYGT